MSDIMASGSRKTRKRKLSRSVSVVLLAILAFAFFYSVAFNVGPSSYGDDPTYLNLAYEAINGNFIQSSYIFSVRLLMIYPIALFYKLFGVSLLSDSLWDALSFVGTVAVAFFLGRELYNDRAGIIAAFLLSFFPLVAILAPTVSDNIPMMFITSLAMLSLLYAQRKSSKPWYMASGVFLIASALVTPEGFIIIPIATAYVLVEILRKKIRINRVSIHLAYGIAIAAVLLMAFNYINSGKPLITLSTNSNYFSAVGVKDASGQYITIGSANQNLNFYPQWMFPYNIIGTVLGDIKNLDLNPIAIWGQIYSRLD